MTSFILICAVMLVAAIVFVTLPLVRSLPAAGKGEPAVPPRAKAAAFALAVALPIAAVALYGNLTNFPWDDPISAAAVPPGHGTPGDGGSMAQATAQLEARLRANPDDVEGWRMLGRTYLVSGDAAKAVAAYRNGDRITGGKDAGLRLDLAEALVLAEDSAGQGEAKEILDAALSADATNQKALWYSGVLAARANDNETAGKRWTKLLETSPPENIREIIVAQLQAIGVEVPGGAAGAAPAMGGMGGMGGGPAAAAEPEGRTIRIALSVDPSLAGKVKPGTPVFVSARQPGIPGPPLAAVRISSDDLPTTVTLSDANSMIEGRNLSSVDEVEVVARVAFGGTAITASGDLVGETSHRKGAAPDVDVVINKVTP